MDIQEKVISFLEKTISLVKSILKGLLQIRLNRNSLVFFVFLCISTGFWFLMTLMEVTSISRDYTLVIKNTPKNVILTSKVPEKVKVNLTSNGFNLLFNYKISEIPILRLFSDQQISNTIVVDYEDLEHTSYRITIDNATLKRGVSKDLSSTIRISSIYPSQIDIAYTKGAPKRVPVKFVGNITPAELHVLNGVDLQQNYVDVYAPALLYDSIKYVTTEPIHLENVEDTIVKRVALHTIEGAKVTPDSIDIKICVDLYVEKTLSVPVYSVNIPSNKMLRFFPMKVDVSFRVSAAKYNQVSENDFLLLVDYKKLNTKDKFCTVELGQAPEYASRVHINPERVEYVFETVDQ